MKEAKAVVKKLENKETKPPEKIIPDYAWGYVQGFENGFKAGLIQRPSLESERRLAFDEGVRHIVTLAEDFLVKELKLASRDALAKSGKIPPWWIITLVTEFCEKPQTIQRDEGEI